MGIENTGEKFEEVRRAPDGGQNTKAEGQTNDRETEQYVSPEGTTEEIERQIEEQILRRASNTHDPEELKEIDARIKELRIEHERSSA